VAVVAGGAATMTTEGDRAARRPSRPPAGWVFGAALGAFLAALALLAFQVRAGEDPALGEPVAQAQQTKPRQVLIRRVIKRVVIHHPPGASAAGSPPAPAQTSAPATTSSAPAPAPVPAPLTTQSS
jgi:hypothetical protein